VILQLLVAVVSSCRPSWERWTVGLLKKEQEQPSSCKTAVWVYTFLTVERRSLWYGMCMVQCECKCLIYVVLIPIGETKETKRSDAVLLCIVPEVSLVFVRQVITEK
jgi:hypothetical protein